MMLADLGADVIRVDRVVPGPPVAAAASGAQIWLRGRRSIAVDLKHPDGVEALLTLVEGADALTEGYRPGVAERLGFGPDVCLARNPRLVYGRVTGWGQDGPYAHTAGHDLNYIALSGALGAMGRRGETPAPPLNLLGDYGGGGMMLAFGLVCALLEAKTSGRGQVVDVGMVDGTAILTTIMHGMRALGAWTDLREDNLIDGGAPYYDTYETADGGYVSIGAIEPQFYAIFLKLVGLDDEPLDEQDNKSRWPALKERLRTTFRTRTRDEWCQIFEGTDACFAPVLSLAEAPRHPHNVARGTFVEHAGVVQPAPGPRFSRTPGAISRPAAHIGEHTDEVLREAGFDETRIIALRAAGAVHATT
jgi:alpha-methylacyl-CoA racemase